MITIPGYSRPPSYFARNISLTPAGNISSTTLQAGIEELDSEKTTESYVNNATAAVPTGRKNLLYNGAMQVAQRGTNATGMTTPSYRTADRWLLDMLNLGTWANSIENDAPVGSGFAKSLKMLCTTAAPSPAAGGYCYVQQGLEGQDLQGIAKGTTFAKPLTISFWVKSNLIGNYVVRLFDNDNSRTIGATYQISASDTWERKVITFAADTIGSLDNNNDRSLGLYFALANGSDTTSGTLNTSWESFVLANFAAGQTNLAASVNNYWQVTGVQLEIGDEATDFEHKPFGVELKECERYFEKSFGYSIAPAHNTGGFAMLPNMGSLGCGGNSYTTVMFRTEKRAANGTLRWFDPLASHAQNENWARTITNCTSGTAFNTAGSFSVYESNFTGYFQIGTGTTTIAEWTCETEI